MIPLTLAQIAKLTGGQLVDVPDPIAEVTGSVVADSRHIEPGSLFVAHQGERVDGHDFAAEAISAGAVAVLAARPVAVPAIVVDDPLVALGQLARSVLGRLPKLVVVAVTGSSGKTTTKDLLAQVLTPLGPVVAAEKSFNTEIGVPLTILRATPETRVLVLEFGARGRGHIEYLCGIARPRIGVVLNVGAAHLGEFGSKEQTAASKAELVEALPARGTAVLNADDPRVAAMAERTAAHVFWFGHGRRANIRAEDLVLDELGRPAFTLVTPAGSTAVSLSLHGEHQVSNALAAAAVGFVLGLDVARIAELLGSAGPRSPWRMEVVERADGVTVINDAYNANPDSMKAALKALVAIGSGRRTWAVLGEMKELGAASLDEHDAIGRLAVRLDVSHLVAVGEGARAIQLGAAHEGSWNEESAFVPDVSAAVDLLRDQLRPGDVVLVKASRAAGLEAVAEELLAVVPTPQRGDGE